MIKRREMRWFLLGLALALTFLSMRAQYRFWAGLFDSQATGLVAATVFEITRLSFIFTLLTWGGVKRAVSIVIYAFFGFFCASIGATAWISEMIEMHNRIEEQRMREYNTRVERIKTAFADSMQTRISKIDQDLYWIDSKLASNPNSAYWIRRRERLREMRRDVDLELENFLKEKPEDLDAWLQNKAALLGIRLDPIGEVDTRFNAIEQAVQTGWNWDPDEARKIVVSVFVLVVELGIILLALISQMSRDRQDEKTSTPSIILWLEQEFDPGEIKTFAEKCSDAFEKTGTLPPASQLAVKLRPIREAVLSNGFSDTELRAFFDHYGINSRTRKNTKV